jgi:hypothetical protein
MRMLKAPSPGPCGPTSPPKGEVSLRDGRLPHLSLWGRGRREAAGEGAFFLDYRVNDWALPASTLMMLPVDLAEASEAKK